MTAAGASSGGSSILRCDPSLFCMEWDAENRLVAVKQGSTTLASFVYDGRGRRHQKTAGGVTRTFVHAGRRVAEERLSTGSTTHYFFGLAIDDVLAKQDASNGVFYYAKDHLGSVRQITNTSGGAIVTRDYDPWGSPLQGGGESGYAFTGREWEAETGLYYYRARYYSRTAARFVTADPLGLRAGSNVYRYARNNPVRFTDPLGLCGPKPCFPYFLTYCSGCFCFTLYANSQGCDQKDRPYVKYWRRCRPEEPEKPPQGGTPPQGDPGDGGGGGKGPGKDEPEPPAPGMEPYAEAEYNPYDPDNPPDPRIPDSEDWEDAEELVLDPLATWTEQWSGQQGSGGPVS